MASPTTSEWLAGLYEPALLLGIAAYHFFVVTLESVFKRGEFFAPISRLRDDAFARFWLNFSASRDADISNLTPDQQQEQQQQQQAALTGSSALIPQILALATGTVLDIGPGAGSQIPFFPRSSAIRTIYGAEPCLNLHDQLQKRIDAAGWTDRYRVLHCSAETQTLVPAMKKVGLDSEGVFDSIVCTRVLCSVPRPEETIGGLYRLLKPGGKMLVCEHVVNPWTTRKGSKLARAIQGLYTILGWSFFMGDCHMNRDTGKILKEAASADGGWESVDLESDFEWTTLPYVSGVLVKKNI